MTTSDHRPIYVPNSLGMLPGPFNPDEIKLLNDFIRKAFDDGFRAGAASKEKEG